MNLVHNTSELLALLCAAGVVVSALRWRAAVHKDILVAFILYLAGTLIREGGVYVFGATTWPPEALDVAALGRLVQIAGALLFVRAAMKRPCGEWGWMLVFVAAAIGAALL